MSFLDLRVSLSASARHYRRLINKRLVKYPDFELVMLHKFTEQPTFAAMDLVKLADLSIPDICCFCGVPASNYQTAREEFIQPKFSCHGFSSGSMLQLSIPFQLRYGRCMRCGNSIVLSLSYLAKDAVSPPDWYILDIRPHGGPFAQAWIKSLLQKNKHLAVEMYDFFPISRSGGRWR